ncbi:hypothetical protein D9M71_762170 [compost metagenome]
MLPQSDGEKQAQCETRQRHDDEHFALAAAIREIGEQQHAEHGPQIRQDGQHAHHAHAGVG